MSATSTVGRRLDAVELEVRLAPPPSEIAPHLPRLGQRNDVTTLEWPSAAVLGKEKLGTSGEVCVELLREQVPGVSQSWMPGQPFEAFRCDVIDAPEHVEGPLRPVHRPPRQTAPLAFAKDGPRELLRSRAIAHHDVGRSEAPIKKCPRLVEVEEGVGLLIKGVHAQYPLSSVDRRERKHAS